MGPLEEVSTKVDDLNRSSTLRADSEHVDLPWDGAHDCDHVSSNLR